MKGLVLLDWQLWESENSCTKNQNSTDSAAAIFVSLLCPLPVMRLLLSGVHLYLWDIGSFKSCPFCWIYLQEDWTQGYNGSCVSLQDPNLLKIALWGHIHHAIAASWSLLCLWEGWKHSTFRKMVFFFFEVVKTCYIYQGEHSNSNSCKVLQKW